MKATMKSFLILLFSVLWMGVQAQSNFGAVALVMGMEQTSYDDQIDIESIKVFPNPTIDYFEIAHDKGIHKIGVFSLIGKNVMMADHEAGNRYDVSEFRTGIYLVRLMDEDGEVVKVVRLSKR